MIKVLLVDPNKGRNKASFQHFKAYARIFEQVGIKFVTYGNHDFVFLGNENFQLRKERLDTSIEYGITEVNKHRAPTFLIDSSDSTSIVGSYEILIHSNARMLFKNQLLYRDEYKKLYTMIRRSLIGPIIKVEYIEIEKIFSGRIKYMKNFKDLKHTDISQIQIGV